MPPDQEVLTEIRIALARLETKMDEAMVSREHLEARLAPLTENMNKWKGGLAAIIFVSGSVGAAITALANHLFAGPGPK